MNLSDIHREGVKEVETNVIYALADKGNGDSLTLRGVGHLCEMGEILFPGHDRLTEPLLYRLEDMSRLSLGVFPCAPSVHSVIVGGILQNLQEFAF